MIWVCANLEDTVAFPGELREENRGLAGGWIWREAMHREIRIEWILSEQLKLKT